MIKYVNIILIVIGFIILWFGYDYILNNTLVGERIMTTTEQAEMLNMETGIWLLDLLGDRGMFYVVGWRDFLTHPITGIGYDNFSNVHRVDMHFSLHSEYLIHLTEGGLVASLLFLSFYYNVIKYLLKSWKKERSAVVLSLLFSVLLYLLVGLTAREIMYIQFYPMMGLWIAEIIKHKSMYDSK